MSLAGMHKEKNLLFSESLQNQISNLGASSKVYYLQALASIHKPEVDIDIMYGVAPKLIELLLHTSTYFDKAHGLMAVECDILMVCRFGQHSPKTARPQPVNVGLLSTCTVSVSPKRVPKKWVFDIFMN